MTDEGQELNAPPERRTTIVRDNTFIRCVADRAWVVDLGRDYEISLMQVGPTMDARLRRGTGDEVQEGYESTPTITEVARVRMPPYAALQLAVHALDRLIDSGRVDGRGLLAQLTEIVESYEQKPEPEEDDSNE